MCEELSSDMPGTTYFVENIVGCKECKQEFHFEDAAFCTGIGH